MLSLPRTPDPVSSRFKNNLMQKASTIPSPRLMSFSAGVAHDERCTALLFLHISYRNHMKLTTRLSLTLLALAIPALSSAATLTLSIVRTTMPQDQWNAIAGAAHQYEGMFAGYADGYGFTYSIQSNANSIDFVYSFSHGWDWPFYDLWQNQVLTLLNQSLPPETGFRWDVRVSGDMDPATNPWNDVGWLGENVIVRDGNFIGSPVIGWFWADNWSPQGDFWAFSYEFKTLGWLYVYNLGYYYADGAWFWMGPGYSYAWKFSDDGGWIPLSDL